MACAEPLADGIREREENKTSAAWKRPYLKAIIGSSGPPGRLRGVLTALWNLSDPMGRTWHSLRSIAHEAKTPKRTLQRYLDELEEEGWIKKTTMTWAQLALEQANFGFRLPARHDEANATVLIQLTFKGKLAMEEMEVRIVDGGHNGHNPRPKRSDRPMAKMAHDPGNSVLDVHNQSVRDPGHCQPPTNFSVGHLESTELEGWRALVGCYDIHYHRVYLARPTSEIPMRLAKPLGGHIADLAVVLRARLHERNVTISLEEAIYLIADKAMRAWLDSGGSDGKFLKKVAHRMSELQNDLPRRAKHALDAILAEMSPKPEPRTTAANVVAFAPRKPQPIVEVPTAPQVKPSDCADAHGPQQIPVTRKATGELDQVKPDDCTDAPTPHIHEVSQQIPATRKATGELDQAKPNDRADAREAHVPKDCADAHETHDHEVSRQIPAARKAAGKLDQVKPNDRTDAPEKQASDAQKLVERLGKPAWCDENMAREMLHARSPDVVLETISRLRIDEKSMTRPKIFAMIFIALYGPEARNDNRC
jgi:DNA-binding Lrp family transcriptional regulator